MRELVLLTLDAAGGRVEGRTAMQKLAYFSAGAVGRDVGHRAHYYGPYSREVEAALNNAAFAGDLEETVRPFNGGRAYTYTLTDQGKEMATTLRPQHPAGAQRLTSTVEKLGNLVPGFSQHPLSIAAKVDLIVGQQGQPTAATDIPELAKKLGWDVGEDDVQRAIQVLVGLERVMTS